MSKVTLTFISLLMASSFFFASSMYSPSLPDIETSLNTTASLAQQSMSYFFVALAISQLICGPLSERFGRKPIALISSLIYLLGSIGYLMSDNIHVLLLSRIIQGAGVGGLYLLCRTILQDSFSRTELMGLLAWMGVLFMALPGLTPVIGGYISECYGWMGNFVFMAVIGVIITLVIFFIKKETIKETNPNAIKPKQMLNDYWMIASNTTFLAFLAMMFSANSCIMLFQITGAFVANNEFSLSATQFGICSIALITSSISARLIWNRYLKNNITDNTTMSWGCAIQLVGSVITTYSISVNSFVMIVIGFTVTAFGASLLITIAAVSALYLFPNHKGQVGAIYGALQMLAASIFTLCLSMLPTTHTTLVEVSWFLASVAIAALLLLKKKAIQLA